MSETVKVAGIQMEPVILDKKTNLQRCLELARKAAAEGAQLVIFPEAALTGYVYGSLAEATPLAEPIPGPSTETLSALCHELGLHVVVGLLEHESGKVYNASMLLGPSGLIGKYRKLHLPYVGVDRFVNHGDLPLRVFDTELGKIGLAICYDLDFPEHCRVLTLLGAELIVAITNWPEGVEFIPDYVLRSRARENLVHHIAINRVGEERGVRFFGRSQVVNCTGAVLAEGKPYEEDILYVEVCPAQSRVKHKVMIPGELEVDMLRDRRPEFYGPLVQ